MLKFIIVFLTSLFIVSVNAQANDIVIRPGDVLKIEIPGEVDFESAFQVKRDGTVNLPEVGKISIVGKTLHQTNTDLSKILGQEYRAINHLKVYLIERRVLIQVLGFVKQPGLIDLPEDGNVQMALQKAGGASAGAQLNKLQFEKVFYLRIATGCIF